MADTTTTAHTINNAALVAGIAKAHRMEEIKAIATLVGITVLVLIAIAAIVYSAVAPVA